MDLPQYRGAFSRPLHTVANSPAPTLSLTGLNQIETLAVMALHTRLISGGHSLTIAPLSADRGIRNSQETFARQVRFHPSNSIYNVTRLHRSMLVVHEVEVHEVLQDGPIRTILDELLRRLDWLCLTEDQICDFVERLDDWLTPDGYGTMFLFKRGIPDSNFTKVFAGFVGVWPGHPKRRLDIVCYELDHIQTWKMKAQGHPRIVIPKF